MRETDSAGALRIDFTLRGLDGRIDVSLTRNADPRSLGYSLLSGGEPVEFAKDFPVCHATVTYPADGYAAVFGWTQMVRSTDGAETGFAMDPIAIYRHVPTPFCWYGLKPELFDAPSDESRNDRDWEAHSFLCVSPDAVLTPQVRAIAGFSWGFTITSGHITPTMPVLLGPEAWDSHLGLLRASYPKWVFDSGYRSA
ncbi:MAG: hypothetical protein ABSA02_31995 [Trebonia sp.]|jgi:hypothetical protein